MPVQLSISRRVIFRGRRSYIHVRNCAFWFPGGVGDVLPVVDITIALSDLGNLVDEVAACVFC